MYSIFYHFPLDTKGSPNHNDQKTKCGREQSPTNQPPFQSKETHSDSNHLKTRRRCERSPNNTRSPVRIQKESWHWTASLSSNRTHPRRAPEKETTTVVSLNVRNAFDRVWHTKFFRKMRQLDISNPHDLAQNELSQREDISSYSRRKIVHKKTNISRRIPRFMSLPNPIQYLHIQLPHLFRKTTDTIRWTHAWSPHIPTKTRIHLLKAINHMEDWITRWKKKINKGKSGGILFNNQKPTIISELQLQRVSILWYAQIKYLGVIMDKHIYWRAVYVATCLIKD